MAMLENNMFMNMWTAPIQPPLSRGRRRLVCSQICGADGVGRVRAACFVLTRCLFQGDFSQRSKHGLTLCSRRQADVEVFSRTVGFGGGFEVVGVLSRTGGCS